MYFLSLLLSDCGISIHSKIPVTQYPQLKTWVRRDILLVFGSSRARNQKRFVHYLFEDVFNPTTTE